MVNGNKAIKVNGNTYRLDADVLPCIEHRRYRYFNSVTDNDYVRGIAFQGKNGGRWIINYPEQNYENLTAKNVETGGKLKDTIRIVKRIRNIMSGTGSWDSDRSPSFYLECLIWNAPTYLFDGNHVEVVFNVLKYLHSDLTEKKGTDKIQSYKQTTSSFCFTTTFGMLMMRSLLSKESGASYLSKCRQLGKMHKNCCCTLVLRSNAAINRAEQAYGTKNGSVH